MASHIVVGAGSAGAIVAARLSEQPGTQVLLIEAGPDYESQRAVPADLLDSKNLPGPAHDWGFNAVPVDGRALPYARGKVVGGTSAVNAAGALWPRPQDLDAWAERGNVGWSFADIAPHLQRLETDPAGSGPHHGHRGPIPIARYGEEELVPIQRAFRDGCLASAFAACDDHNDLSSSGVGPWPMNRIGDTRISTLLSHLNPARTRANLKIHAKTTVDRLVFDGTTVRGVRLTDGSVEEAQCVTLSAGAIGSPAILLRSGIGPREELEALGIPVVVDLPGVGARLWDHSAVPIRLVPRAGECVIGRDPRFQVMARFTAPGSSQSDDMQLVMTTHLDLRTMPALAAEAGVPVVAVLRVALMLPRGYGRLMLQSRDPGVQPRIELNYCSDWEDERRLMEGVRLAWKVLQSPPLSSAYLRVAGLSETTIGSDGALANYIRANIGTYCHASGTVPIGVDGDPEAALDQKCRVRGTENLFVADASVFPKVPGAVPNLTVMMIGERVAGWLKSAIN
jgi:choline dehydrogenase